MGAKQTSPWTRMDRPVQSSPPLELTLDKSPMAFSLPWAVSPFPLSSPPLFHIPFLASAPQRFSTFFFAASPAKRPYPHCRSFSAYTIPSEPIHPPFTPQTPRRHSRKPSGSLSLRSLFSPKKRPPIETEPPGRPGGFHPGTWEYEVAVGVIEAALGSPDLPPSPTRPPTSTPHRAETHYPARAPYSPKRSLSLLQVDLGDPILDLTLMFSPEESAEPDTVERSTFGQDQKTDWIPPPPPPPSTLAPNWITLPSNGSFISESDPRFDEQLEEESTLASSENISSRANPTRARSTFDKTFGAPSRSSTRDGLDVFDS